MMTYLMAQTHPVAANNNLRQEKIPFACPFHGWL